MPLIEQPRAAAPSTLADVIAQVVEAFDAMGDATPIMVGKQYLEQFGAGSPPRVVFVPETDGRMGPPIEMGDAASCTHGCQVFVRAAESGDDLERFKNAYELQGEIVSCIAVAGSGRIEWGNHGDGSPVDVDTHGAELTFGFKYRRAIRHSARRWALPAPAADTSARQPLLPPGEAGTLDSFEIDVTPTEES